MNTVIKVLSGIEYNKETKLCSAVYLYYDGFENNNIKIENIDLNSLGL